MADLELDEILQRSFTTTGLMRIANKSSAEFSVVVGYKGSRRLPRKVAKAKTAMPRGVPRLSAKKSAHREVVRVERAARVDGEKPTRWKRVVSEFHDLLCTKSKKYSNLRKQITTYWKGSQITLVGAIAGAMGSVIGVSAAAIVPTVALVLAIFVQIGKQAYCAGNVE